MEEKESILKENFDEYFESGEREFKSKNYNSAVTLFFKAVVVGVDIFILKKEGFVPSSHTNRFRIVQEKYKKIYEILDKDFPFYQDSYTKKADKEMVKIIKEDAKKIKEMSQI